MSPQEIEFRKKHLNDLSHRVLGLCIEVHRELGPGLLESAYEEALAYELIQAGIAFERQRETPLRYKGVSLNCGYRLDFIIEGGLILELKAAVELLPVHNAQLLTYLKLENLPIGLLINFNVPVLKNGVRRIVAGEIFKNNKIGGSSFNSLCLVLCAFVSSWFKNHS